MYPEIMERRDHFRKEVTNYFKLIDALTVLTAGVFNAEPHFLTPGNNVLFVKLLDGYDIHIKTDLNVFGIEIVILKSSNHRVVMKIDIPNNGRYGCKGYLDAFEKELSDVERQLLDYGVRVRELIRDKFMQKGEIKYAKES